MSAIIWDDVVAFAPELDVVALAAQTDILAHVNAALNVTAFGGEAAPRLRMARIYLAAHHAVLSQRAASDAAGPVQSESEEGVSVTYGQNSVSVIGTDPVLDATEYGKLYRQIIRGTAALRGPFVA